MASQRPQDQCYRIVDVHPYLGREEEYTDLSFDEAVNRAEDLTGERADVILSDFDSDGLDLLPWEWTDDETGREVTMRLEVEPDPAVWPQNPNDLAGKLAASLKRDHPPEAGGMSTSDGLGR